MFFKTLRFRRLDKRNVPFPSISLNIPNCIFFIEIFFYIFRFLIVPCSKIPFSNFFPI